MAQVKQPRASIACSRNRDPDYLDLASTVEGLAAVAVFDALLCAAKDQGNGGVFVAPDSVIAMLCGVPLPTFNAAKSKLESKTWISVIKEGGLIIRSFEKWNPAETRGGARPGAGRPPATESKESIPDSNIESNPIQKPLSPSPLPKETTLPEANASGPPKKAQRKPHWGEPLSSQLKLLEGCPARGGPFPFLNMLARECTEVAVQSALVKFFNAENRPQNWRHAAAWLKSVAREEQAVVSGQGPEPGW